MNRIFRSFLSLSAMAAIFVSCSKDNSVQPEPTMGQELQAALDNGIATMAGKGISLAVILPDGDIWTGVGGISHGTTPITPDMLFSIGSATKTFTSATILQLAEEGTLSLEDSLCEWLPDYPNIDNTITIRQLLNHTGGIFDLVENPQLWTDIFADLYRTWTIEEVLSGYILAPYFPKGTGWHYSSTGYMLLRLIIREAAGDDVSAQYRDRLMAPNGLDGMFTAVEESPAGIVAHGWFDWDEDGDYNDFSNIPATAFYSAIGGGVFATAEDLASWAKAMYRDRTVLSPEYYNQMMDFVVPAPGEPLVYGYGLGVCWFSPELFNNLTAYGHGGNPPGYAAGCFYLPDYDVCIGILDNTEEGETMPVINDILEIVTRHVGAR
jgi:CubicO group peptidase (beta-lactamase class C family)